MKSEYNIGGASDRKGIWQERESEHRQKQGVLVGTESTPEVEEARRTAKKKAFQKRKGAFEP